MKDYIPELSELRMIRRAPDGPLPFSDEDKSYVIACLEDVERSFGVLGAEAGRASSARVLIKQLIEWWRTLEPATEAQRDAYGRMPGAIRLIDTVATWVEERAGRGGGKADSDVAP
jgi:hypothetical protein